VPPPEPKVAVTLWPVAFSKAVTLNFTASLIRPGLKDGDDLLEFICLEDNQYGAAGGFTPAQPDK